MEQGLHQVKEVMSEQLETQGESLEHSMRDESEDKETSEEPSSGTGHELKPEPDQTNDQKIE